MSSSLRLLLSRCERAIWRCALLALVGWGAFAPPLQGSDAHDILVVGGDAASDQHRGGEADQKLL